MLMYKGYGVNLPAIGTALGAWGGFMDSPMFFKHLTSYWLGRLFAVFMLIWQGGGSFDILESLKYTIILYVGGIILDKIYYAVVPTNMQFKPEESYDYDMLQ